MSLLAQFVRLARVLAWLIPTPIASFAASDVPSALTNTLHAYVAEFNRYDVESVTNRIPNAGAAEWMCANVPLFECPDKQLETIYYFRWWTYRKHLKATPDGFVVTEFLPAVSWSKKHNTINCPAGHHLYEGRWLRDSQYLDDYTRFYFGGGGDPGGFSKVYSNWLIDAVYARFLVNADRAFVVGLLDRLVACHADWRSDGAPGDAFQKSRMLDNGLYWQIDSWEGQEFSIGGTGVRIPMNCYMYANALAISRIAELAGRNDLAERYRAEARLLAERIQSLLWDPEGSFFKTLRHPQVPTNQYDNQAAENTPAGQRVVVREIFGYVPWYFNLPEDRRGYEAAWKQLTDPEGFSGRFGPPVAERRHPNFKINTAGCEWRGASWPFATSQTLVALANLLNNYHQSAMSKQDYFAALLTYARSHRRTLNASLQVPWIDESLNPDTGLWIPTADDPPRGKDYNHSTFCDLVISGLVGLRPRPDNIIEINPLLPDGTWDYFRLGSVRYHGHELDLYYDRTGARYGKGRGLQLWSQGRRLASASTLQRLTAILPE